MQEETQNNIGEIKQEEKVPEQLSAMEKARNKFAHDVEDTPAALNPKKQNTGDNSEGMFIDFVAKKSQELPDKQEPGAVEKKPEKKKRWRNIFRTYQTDAAEKIRDEKLSLANIAISEQQTRDAKPLSPTKEKQTTSWKYTLLALVSGTLIVGSVALLLFLYIGRRENTVVTVTSIGSLVPANEQITLVTTDLSRSDVLAALDDIVGNTTGTINDVVNVKLITGPDDTQINAPEFLELLETSIDAALLRSIEGPFMLGIHVLETPNIFLVLKTTFFENAFAGMLRWENQLDDDLPFLVREVQLLDSQPVATSSATTTAPTTTTVVLTVETSDTFEDTIIDNKDARGHIAVDGEYDILYAFSDPETLIITTNTETLRWVFKRIIISRFDQ